MRKCVIKVSKTVYDSAGTGRYQSVEEEATFHQFGTEAQYANDGDERIGITVAIVELKDGTVMKVEPTSVRFTP